MFNTLFRVICRIWFGAQVQKEKMKVMANFSSLLFFLICPNIARIPASEFLIPCGKLNGHVGRAGTGYREVHGGMGYGRPEPDVEGERILEYARAF